MLNGLYSISSPSKSPFKAYLVGVYGEYPGKPVMLSKEPTTTTLNFDRIRQYAYLENNSAYDTRPYRPRF